MLIGSYKSAFVLPSLPRSCGYWSLAIRQRWSIMMLLDLEGNDCSVVVCQL